MSKYLLLLCLPLVVLSWWDVGHMLTAAIAEMRLTTLDPYALAHFKELITSINPLVSEKTRTFIESAVWPDEIKEAKYNMHLWDSWHFKDSAYISDNITIPKLNYTEEIVNSIAVMTNAEKVLKTNILKNTAERALFARYVVHLVGDIHQPLHSVALFNKTAPAGDIGGNKWKVQLLNGSLSNFHSYWDSGAYRLQNDSWTMVRPLSLQNLTVLKTVANDLIKQYGAEAEVVGRNIDPIVWAQESFSYAVNTTYPYISKTAKLNQTYTALTYETSKRRITQAGYRLANFIIDIYKTAAKPDINKDQVWETFKDHAYQHGQIDINCGEQYK